MATIFAGDESGNLGFALNEGGTRYFVFSLMRFEDPVTAREQIEAFKRKQGFAGHEFSYNELIAQRWSGRVFDLIASLDFHGWVLIVDKQKLGKYYRALDNPSLYALFVTEAIERIPLPARANTILVLDEIDRSGRILYQIRRALKFAEIPQGFKKIVAKRSEGEPLIQVADLVSGAVHRWKRYGDTTHLEGVAHNLEISEFKEKKPPS